jgi:hypothetical protein
MSWPTGGPGITTHRAYKIFALLLLMRLSQLSPYPRPLSRHSNTLNPVCRQLVATYPYPCLVRFPPQYLLTVQ